MYTVLIAEDEMLVRMGLTASVMWEKLDMQLVGDVADGQRAYELFLEKKPDILITDLSMPRMDGLTLIRRIRESGEKCAVIVVTCMDRFDLLHEAMELGVTSYLVKVTMTMRDIESALLKARDSLGAPRQREEDPQSADRAQAAFEDYLFGRSDLEKLRHTGAQAGFDVQEAYYLCFVQVHSPHPISWQLQKAFRSMAAERLKTQHVLHVLQQENALALLFSRTPKVHDMISQCESFRQYMLDSFNMDLLIGATMENVSVADLPALLERMRQVCLTPSEGTVRWFDAQGRLVDAHIRAEFDHLREALWQVADYSFAYGAVVDTYDMEDAFDNDAALFRTLTHQLARALWKQAGLSREHQTVLEKGLEDTVSATSALQYLFRYGVERLKTYRPEIRTLITFILRHPEEELSLKKAAQLVLLHPQYLSNLFKKEVGVNYSEFVLNTRILSAQRMLLQSGRSVQQTADLLGFSDQAYFIRKFKQITGKTPAQWRRVKKCGS